MTHVCVAPPMPFRPVLLTLLVWLAALVALASLWLPETMAPRLAVAALGVLGCALLVWRGWKPRAIAQEVQHPAESSLDDGFLLEAAAQVARACANAADLNDALRGVGHLLRHELGARQLRVALVEHVGSDAADVRLKPLLDLAASHAKRGATVLSTVAASALRERGVVSEPDSGHALVVLESARPVALVEFESLEINVGSLALSKLLEVVRSELNDVAQRSRSNSAGLSPARLRTLRAQFEAPDFLAAVASDRQVSLIVVEPQSLRIVGLSRRAERDFALRRTRVVGKTVAQAFGEAIALAAKQAVQRVFEDGRSVEQELHWATPRGQRGANVSVSALRHADGAPRLLIASARALPGAAPRGGERRAMPRHGLLRDDAQDAGARILARPRGAVPRRAGQK